MAVRTFALLALVVAGAMAEPSKKRAPISPTDVYHGTVEMLWDVYGAAYDTVEGFAHKTGVPAQVKAALPEYPLQHVIGLTCSKVGCKPSEVNGHINKAKDVVQQVKAQVLEYVAKATDFLHEFAGKAVTTFEQYVPSYKGTIGKNFWDLGLFAIYFLIVAYVVFCITWFIFSLALSIFCCFFCCRCFRSRGNTSVKGKKNTAKQAAAAKQAPAAKKGAQKK